MGEADDLLKGVYDSNRLQQRKDSARSNYEERVVAKLMEKAGLGKEIKVLRRLAAEKTGKPRLTFSWFYDQYPSFPIWLGFRKIAYAFQITVPDLFNKFPSAAMVQTWDEVNDERPVEDKPVGLIFDWPSVKGTQMIIHNGDSSLEEHETKIVRRIGYGRGQLVWIERFDPFFARLLNSWAP